MIPLPTLPGPALDVTRSTSVEAVDKARETLKVLRLERQILGTALTTIYESHTKGLITQPERDRLLEKYKVDLSTLDKSIKDNQRIVDLYDLESEREELIKSFKDRLTDIDAQMKTLKSGGMVNRSQDQKPAPEREKKNTPPKDDGRRSQASQEATSEEKKASDSEQQEVADAEKRIEKIREEILQAMDRLEQIEAEG
jgi:chromosome segregation ATPase